MQYIIYYLFLFSHAMASIAPGTISSFQENKSVIIRIPKQAVVTNSVVDLGTIADIVCVPSAWCKELEKLPLTKIVANKKNQNIPGSYIKSRILEITSNSYQINFDIPEKIELKLMPVVANSNSVEEEVVHLIQRDVLIPSDAKIRITNIFGVIPDSINKRNLTVLHAGSINASNLQRVLEFTVQEKNNLGKINFQQKIKIKAGVFAKRWVAKRDIGFRKKISIDDFELKEVDLALTRGLDSEYIDEENFEKIILSAEFMNKSLSAGMVFSSKYVYQSPDVERGNKVNVILVSESGLKIITKGIVQKSAAVGDSLPVKMEKTGKVLSGELIDKSTMEIRL